METSKKKEYLKLVLAFVLGVALTLGATGAAGTLYMGSLAEGTSITPISGCTLCGVKGAITDMRGGTSATWTLDALADQIDHYGIYNNVTMLENILGRNAVGDYSTWTLQALGDNQQLFYYLTEDNIQNVIGQDSSGNMSSWTLQDLAEQISNVCR
ncbi:MAG: hypothetical protein WCT46_05265 [Candidatus Gracilibacteria bacterium]